jgi:hypothetical protein
VTALALATGVNGLYLLLWFSDRSQAPPEPVTPAMLWILATLEPRPPERKPAPPRTPRRAAIVVTPEQSSPPASVSPPPEVTLVPEAQAQQDTEALAWIDWSAESLIAATSFLRMEELDERKLESAERETAVRQSFRAGVPRKKGQYERLQNGVDILWYTDLCYYEFDPAQGRNFRTVCKARTAAERLSSHLAEELGKAVKPRYLGGKRELPDPPDSHLQIP